MTSLKRIVSIKPILCEGSVFSCTSVKPGHESILHVSDVWTHLIRHVCSQSDPSAHCIFHMKYTKPGLRTRLHLSRILSTTSFYLTEIYLIPIVSLLYCCCKGVCVFFSLVFRSCLVNVWIKLVWGNPVLKRHSWKNELSQPWSLFLIGPALRTPQQRVLVTKKSFSSCS